MRYTASSRMGPAVTGARRAALSSIAATRMMPQSPAGGAWGGYGRVGAGAAGSNTAARSVHRGLVDEREHLVALVERDAPTRDPDSPWRMIAQITEFRGNASSWIARPTARQAGGSFSLTSEQLPRRSFSSVIMSPSDISCSMRLARMSAWFSATSTWNFGRRARRCAG